MVADFGLSRVVDAVEGGGPSAGGDQDPVGGVGDPVRIEVEAMRLGQPERRRGEDLDPGLGPGHRDHEPSTVGIGRETHLPRGEGQPPDHLPAARVHEQERVVVSVADGDASVVDEGAIRRSVADLDEVEQPVPVDDDELVRLLADGRRHPPVGRGAHPSRSRS